MLTTTDNLWSLKSLRYHGLSARQRQRADADGHGISRPTNTPNPVPSGPHAVPNPPRSIGIDELWKTISGLEEQYVCSTLFNLVVGNITHQRSIHKCCSYMTQGSGSRKSKLRLPSELNRHAYKRKLAIHTHQFKTRKNALHALSDICEAFFAYREATVGGLLIHEFAEAHPIEDAMKAIINVLSSDERMRICNSPWREFPEWWRRLQAIYQEGGDHKAYGSFSNTPKDPPEADKYLFEELPEVVSLLRDGAITIQDWHDQEKQSRRQRGGEPRPSTFITYGNVNSMPNGREILEPKIKPACETAKRRSERFLWKRGLDSFVFLITECLVPTSRSVLFSVNPRTVHVHFANRFAEVLDGGLAIRHRPFTGHHLLPIRQLCCSRISP